MTQNPSRTPGFWALCALLIAVTAYRIVSLQWLNLSLSTDEAQYVTWAFHPDWGYYSKPPLLGWALWLSTRIFGLSELGVRALSLSLYPLITLLTWGLAKRLFDAKVAWYSALILISMPLVALGSWFATTDCLLLLFWTLSLWQLHRAQTGNLWRDWLLTGVWIGAGLLTKYTMVLLPLSAGLYWLLTPETRKHWRNPRAWLAITLALALFSPNIWWNAQHAYVSIKHTAEISQLGRSLFHPGQLRDFVAAQFLGFSPILIWALLWPRRLSATLPPAARYLLFLSLPFLALISTQALLSRANGNWAAPVYIGGSILAGWLFSSRPRLFWPAIGLNIVLVLGLYHHPLWWLWQGEPAPQKLDAFSNARGWREQAEALRPWLHLSPDRQLLVTTRQDAATLSYYLRDTAKTVRIWNPSGRIENHYQLKFDLKDAPKGIWLIVSDEYNPTRFATSFMDVQAVTQLQLRVASKSRTLYLYEARGFRGYR